MSKFTTVLSPSDIQKLTVLLVQDKPEHSATLIRYIEQTILAKLAEQEPVATVSQETFSNDGTSDIITCNLPTGTKLYAHPCVAPVSDKTACDSQNGKYETQDENISGLLNALDNDLIVLGKTLEDYSSLNEALDAVVDWHIKLAMDPLINGGYQLVPIEPTEEMHHAARDWSIGKYGKAIGFEASHGCYKTMIEAAPKYKENKISCLNFGVIPTRAV